MIPKINFTWNVIVTFLMLLFAGLAIAAFCLYRDMKADYDRLMANQSLLLHNGTVEITQTGNGRSHASAPALTLRPSEFRQSGDTLVDIARQAGIKPRRVREAATVTAATSADIVAPAHVVVPSQLADTLALEQSDTIPAGENLRKDVCFSWTDPWLSLSGCVSDSLFRGTISATDTLDIVVHRVPKRFLFFRFGCREVRMDIISRNPHTRLTYARYYKLFK